MTSTNDGKDVKSIQTSGQKGKTYYIELYKSLEAALGSECKLRERTQYLCEAWRRVYSLCVHSLPATQAHLLTWLQRHTSKTVLQTEWQSPASKDEHAKLDEAIREFISECHNGGDSPAEGPPWQAQLVQRGLWFRRILANPWGHPVLKKLLDSQGEPPSDVEVLEWLKEERGAMLVARLRQLAASKCEDLALALAAALMDRVRDHTPVVPDALQVDDVKDKPKAAKNPPTFADILKAEAGFTVDVWELLIDIEFVLLLKRDKRSRCIQLAKQVPLKKCYQLVERLNSRLATSPKEKKLWKNAKEVAILIAQVSVARCMVVRGCGGGVRLALYWCARALARLAPPRRLAACAAELAAPAATAQHLHTLAAAVHAELKSSKEMIPFMCELYVRAITAGMNELERLKLKTEMEAEARASEQTLASWFTQLGALLSGSERMQCECTLTAFSVHPSPDMYRLIHAAPTLPPVALDHLEPKEETTSEFGSWANDSRSKTNLVKTSETLNLKQSLHQANVLSTAILTEGEGLGLDTVLCQDIAVLLSGPRLKTLSWDMDRELLLENCRAYMERTNCGTRAVTTELKYLNLDPTAFQHLPEEDDEENDMFYGIEKGYEHLVEFQEPEEIWEDTLLQQGIVDTPYTSSTESEISTVRRKKKARQIIASSDDDSDPLSYVAEAKKKEMKKVRPHSKERSKERRSKKSTDPLESRDNSQDSRKEVPKEKKKREKKERKKKEPRQPQQRSLAHLVGMKVTNLTDKNRCAPVPSITDSDYDSQGKSSLNSLNSEGNSDDVVFDGLFSMDELKSPERNPQTDKMGLLKNNEVSITDGVVAVNKPSTKFNQFDIDSNSLSSYHLTGQPYLSSVREEVKKSISRLIEFRRNKNAMGQVSATVSNPSALYKPNDSTASCRMPNAIVRPQSPAPAQICPKIVTIPDIPKMYINKKQSEQITMLKNEVDNYLKKNNTNSTLPTAYGVHKQNNFPSVAAMHESNVEVVRVQNKYITSVIQPPRPPHMVNDNVKPNIQTHNVASIRNFPKPVVDGSKKNFQEFLKELHETINAGAGFNTGVKIVSKQAAYPRKEVKPMSRPTPIVPVNINIDSKVTQSAKPQTLPKKLDTSLNTFSRLSYMHKNKQSDVKLHQVGNSSIECLDKNVKPLPIPSGLDRVIPEQKPARFKCPPSRTETQPAPTKAASIKKYNNDMLTTNKTEKPITALHCPTITHILQSTHTASKPHELKTETQKLIRPCHTPVRHEVKNTALSEKDQTDLIQLLRQQNKLNANAYSQSGYSGVFNRDTAQCSVVTAVHNHDVKQNPNPVPLGGISSNKYLNNTNINIIDNAHNFSASNKDVTKRKPTETYKQKKPVSVPGLKIQPPSTESKLLHAKSNSSRNISKIDPLEHNNIKKTEIKPENKLSNKNDSPNSKITKTATDWESVMDAILAQKTPSRGPKALDVALNKSSFAKAFSDSLREQKILKSNPINDLTGNKGADIKRHPQAKESSGITSPGNKNHATLHNSLAKKSSSTESKQSAKSKPKSAPTDAAKKQSVADVPKKSNPEQHRKLSTEELQKQFTCSLPKEDDPFISGIANSDYDLLEELMDDDLRQEIGELSSDEDNFNPLAPSVSKRKNNLSDKRIPETYSKLNHTIPISATSPINLCLNSTREPITTVAQMPNTKPNNKMPNVYAGASIQANSGIVKTKMNGSAECNGPININQNASKLQIINNLSTKVVISSRRESAIAADDIIPALNSSNLFIAAVPKQRFQNVILLNPNITYDAFSKAESATHSGVSNFNQNTPAPIDKSPNVDIFQTTHLPIPSNDALTIQNDISAPISESNNECTLVNTEMQSNIINKSTPSYETHKDLDETLLKVNYRESENSSYVEKQLTNDIELQSDINLDFNSNKSLEQISLSHAQEMQQLPNSSVMDVVQSDNLLLTNYINKDEDQERLEKKRTSIINRKLSHHCDNEPIPLSFTPLASLNTYIDSQPPNKSNNLICLEENVSKVLEESEVICNINASSLEFDDTKESDGIATVPSVTDKAGNENENDERKDDSRGTPLCPTNNLEGQKLTKQKSKKINGRKTKVRLKNAVSADETKSNEKDSTKARPKKRASKKTNESTKKEENKDKIKKKKDSNKDKTDGKAHKKINKKCDVNATSIGIDFLDIEDALLNSKIPKMFDSEETILPDASVIDKIVHYQGSTDLLDMSSLEETVQSGPKTVEPELFDDLTQFSCDTVSFENIVKEKALLATGFHKENTASPIPVLTLNDVETVLEKEKKSTENELTPKSNENLAVNTNLPSNEEVSVTNKSNVSNCEQNTAVLSGTEVTSTSDPNTGQTNDDVLIFDKIISEIEHTKSNETKQIPEDPPKLVSNPCSVINEENSVTINEDSCIMVSNNIQSKEAPSTSTSQSPTINNPEIPQSYKDSIKIEQVPGAASDPLKQCLRIKLPNGRTFKATVHGKVLLNFDALFAEPSLKSLLLSSLTDKKCYTLNIKQVSTSSPQNPARIVETRIQEINIEPKTNPNLVETINLLSDDEDAEEYQYFKTEFGKYKVRPLPMKTFECHQNNFNKKCQVRLIRMNISLGNDVKVQSGPLLRSKVNKIAATVKEVSVPEQPDNTKPPCANESEIIEIDDSSNDSIVDIVNCSLNCSIDKDLQSQNTKSGVNVEPENQLKNFTKACYVKLVKCDDIATKYKRQKALKQKCFVDLVRVDAVANTTCVNSNRTEENLASDRNLQDSSINNPATIRESSGRTSPVMESYDLIARLYSNKKETKTSHAKDCGKQDTYTCKSLWLETKRVLFSQRSLNKAETLRNGFGHLKHLRNGFNGILCSMAQEIFNPPDLKTLALKYFQNNLAFNYCYLTRKDEYTSCYPWKRTSYLLKRKLNSIRSAVSNKIQKTSNESPNFTALCPSNSENLSSSSTEKRQRNEEVTVVRNNSDMDLEVIILENCQNNVTNDVNSSNQNSEFVDDSAANTQDGHLNTDSITSDFISYKYAGPEEVQANISENENDIYSSNVKSKDIKSIEKTEPECIETQHPEDKFLEGAIQDEDRNTVASESTNDCDSVTDYLQSSQNFDKYEKSLLSINEADNTNTPIEDKNSAFTNSSMQSSDSIIVIQDETISESLENVNTDGQITLSSCNTIVDNDISTNNNKNSVEKNYPVKDFTKGNEGSNIHRIVFQQPVRTSDCQNGINVYEDQMNSILVLEKDINDSNENKLENKKINNGEIVKNEMCENKYIEFATNTQGNVEVTETDVICGKEAAPEFTINEDNHETDTETDGDNDHSDDKTNNMDQESIPDSDDTYCEDVEDAELDFEDIEKRNYKAKSEVLSSAEVKMNAIDDNACSGNSIGSIDPSDSADTSEIANTSLEEPSIASTDEYETIDDTILNLNIPKITYVNKYKYDERKGKRSVKRKVQTNHYKIKEKRYKNSKEIDYPKLNNLQMMNTSYSREYRRLFNYCSSVQFSYSLPFHKECIDVHKLLQGWPQTGNTPAENHEEKNSHQRLFLDLENMNKPDKPKPQTLAEELVHKECENNNQSSEIKDSNFNMGFGEGSGRVIQNWEGGVDVSKISAATLSDVKQNQPALLSENSFHYFALHSSIICKDNTKNEQIDGINRYYASIQMKNKVKDFFKKTANELSLMNYCDQYKKEYRDSNEMLDFPYGLNRPDFFDPFLFEPTVQVVQVGQLPVSAAAQNPVTCDPRVTQVSDASPPQCSAENSPHGGHQTTIKTEYTELTTADITLPMVHDDYHHHQQKVPIESQEASNIPIINENIPIKTEIKSVVKIELMEELPEEKIEANELPENTKCEMPHKEETFNSPLGYSYDANDTTAPEVAQNIEMMYNGTENTTNGSDDYIPMVQQNGLPEKVDQIAHAMNAAGISTTADEDSYSMLSQKISTEDPTPTLNDSYQKPAINTMTLQQALAQILPSALNQANGTENNHQVLHIVQGKNSSNQMPMNENAQQSVINSPNATSVLHIVQNKNATPSATSTAPSAGQTNAFSGLSLVDAGLQHGGNQLLHIVNTGNSKNATSQLLKRVNLLTNLANVQGGSEQKMVQFVCKSADGKAIQLNASHQRSMVLRLQPVETPTIQANPAKQPENQELSPTHVATNNDAQEIKSRSIYEENYAKFISNASNKHTTPEKGTSLPKFNQAFGKQVYQDDKHDLNGDSHLPQVNTDVENPDCQSQENPINLDHMGQIPSPPLLMRKTNMPNAQSSPNIVQQIKESIGPMNIQTMHGGVIYTRQIPVNIGGGQTINLITVPSTEMPDESGQKQPTEVKFVNQSGIEPSIIKIVPQTQPTSNGESSQENNSHATGSSENNHNPQPQPVLTQMRIKLPMLSKAPQMGMGTRVIRPSFFHIQRNVIGGANQQVYQQLVLTTAPQIGQQTIRLPQPQQSTPRPQKPPAENQSPTESQMSSSTLEQLREFDLVLEQVKERSIVQPNGNSPGVYSQIPTPSADTTDSSVSVTSTSTESSQQVLYSANNQQPLNMSYHRKTTVTTPTTSTYVRSPDSSGITESVASSTASTTSTPSTSATSPTSSTSSTSPTSSTTSTSPTSSTPSTSSLSHASSSHTATTEVKSDPPPHRKKHKSKSRPKASSNPPNTLKLNPTPPKSNNQKPLEDEQTTQRILYILAEYKEQVENSPDKDKPAPRRRTNFPSTSSGSSKRKKRRYGPREMSPIHGEETCRTMGSEDSSCGTSLGDCNESCMDSHSPQDSPRKVVRKLTFEHECIPTPPRPPPQRNVIVADGQTITMARGTAGKPTAAVLMPTNYLLPLVKGGQQIAIVTNRGPKLLTVTGEGGTTNALLLQRLIGPAGLKPVLTRPGFRHVRLPAAALHNLQAFNLTPTTPLHQPDSTASPAPTPAPPDLVDTRATSSPWTDRTSQEVKPERGSSPEGSEPWNLHAPMDPHDYSYEETVRTENMDRTVLVVHKREGTHRQHRLTHVSAAALRHKYAILEHELRLQKSLSEECEDLGVDSPSASELFPEAELLFTASPAHEHAHEHAAHAHAHAPQSSVSCVPQPDLDDQIATDHLIPRAEFSDREDLNIGLEDVGIVTVSEDGTATIALDQEEFARSHPNTTFHSEPTEEGEVQPFTLAGVKGRHMASAIFPAGRGAGTVLVSAPPATVISQASAEPAGLVKYADIENMIDSLPGHNNAPAVPSVLVKDHGLSSRFDNLLTETRHIRISNATSAIVHSTGNATQVIRRVCYEDDKRPKDGRYVIDEPYVMNAGDDAKMIAEENARDVALGSVATDVEDDRSSPERHAELFWDATAAYVRAERRRRLDYSSDSDKCCKSPTFDEASTDSNGVGVHNLRLDSVIKVVERTGKADGTIESEQPALRTYPAKRHAAPDELEGRRRASARGVVKRGCHCCNGSPAPRPKKPRPKKHNADFTATN